MSVLQASYPPDHLIERMGESRGVNVGLTTQGKKRNVFLEPLLTANFLTQSVNMGKGTFARRASDLGEELINIHKIHTADSSR